MLKINILLPGFGIRPVGGFKIAYIYANYLQKKGHQVTIIHAHSMVDDKETFLTDCVQLVKTPPKWFRFVKGIKHIYVHHMKPCFIPKADVCIATSWRTAVFANTLSSEKGKKIYLIQGYEVWGADKKKDVEATWLYNMEKVVISKWLYSIGEEIGASQMHYIPNSISFKKYRIIKPIDGRPPMIAMQYRDGQIKNCQMGLEVMKQVHNINPNIRMVLFGPQKRDSRIPKWVEYYENPAQQMLVEDIYNKATVFLCTSNTEGFGLPPMEAMACGCAAVSTRNGGVEDFIIDEETGILCDVKDTDDMMQKVLNLIDDEKKRVRLAKAGYRIVHTFRWKDSFEKFEKILKM